MTDYAWTRLKVLALIVAAGLAACSGGDKTTKMAQGYLATSACAQNVTQSDCNQGEACQWVVPPVVCNATDGTACNGASAGVCVDNDPCLALDKAGCAADEACSWSATKTLCPVGATCADGGFCHATGTSGTDCACVSPVSSSADGTVAPVECDCSGGGTTGSGGACSCACAPCAAGSVCPPCDCQCDDGGPTCAPSGTCACACPACPAGEDCPPCACDCNQGGGTTVSSGDPCSAHSDETSCAADTANHCGVVPGPGGAFVCAGATAVDTPAPPACSCPECPAGAPCATCNCVAPTDGGCALPPVPTSPVACPAIGCSNVCPNGVTTGADGCPTCTCQAK